MGNREAKLDNARRLRGIYCVDPEEDEYKESIKKTSGKMEVPMEAAVPCKKNKVKKELIEPASGN